MSNFPVLPLILLIAVNAYAQDARSPGSVGRYADGRAYRVDSQGLQLADQIAELEMTIREQEKQLIACEERAATGALRTPENTTRSEQTRCEVSRATCATFIAPLENEVASLKSARLPLQSEVSQLRAERDSLLRQAYSRDTERAAESKARMSELTQAKNRAAELEQRVSELENKLIIVSSKENEKLAELSKLLRQRESELAGKIKREGELLANLDNLTRQLTGSALESPARAMLAVTTPDATSTASQKRLQAELGQIQSLINRRKDLYDSMRSAKKGVTPSLSPLETSKRLSLDKLRLSAKSAASDEEINIVSSGIAEIKGILESDITVLERLLKRL